MQLQGEVSLSFLYCMLNAFALHVKRIHENRVKRIDFRKRAWVGTPATPSLAAPLAARHVQPHTYVEMIAPKASCLKSLTYRFQNSLAHKCCSHTLQYLCYNVCHHRLILGSRRNWTASPDSTSYIHL